MHGKTSAKEHQLQCKSLHILAHTKQKKNGNEMFPFFFCSAYGNRTRVPCVRGMCPSR